MPKLVKIRRKPLPCMALIHEEPVTFRNALGQPVQGKVQIIDDRDEGDDSWPLRDEAELWAYYEPIDKKIE